MTASRATTTATTPGDPPWQQQHLRTRTQAHPAILHLPQVGCRRGACHGIRAAPIDHSFPKWSTTSSSITTEGFQETGMMTAFGAHRHREPVIYLLLRSRAPRFRCVASSGRKCSTSWNRRAERERPVGTDRGVVSSRPPRNLLRNSDNETAAQPGRRGRGRRCRRRRRHRGRCAVTLPRLRQRKGRGRGPRGVPIPLHKKWIVALVALPSRSCAAPISRSWRRETSRCVERRGRGRADRHRTQSIEPSCEYVSADDPYERYQDYGYHVRDYLQQRLRYQKRPIRTWILTNKKAHGSELRGRESTPNSEPRKGQPRPYRARP